MLNWTRRTLSACGVTVNQLVATPTRSWLLEPIALAAASDASCQKYAHLWKLSLRHHMRAQSDIERLFRKEELMLVPFYRCVYGLRLHMFERDHGASRK